MTVISDKTHWKFEISFHMTLAGTVCEAFITDTLTGVVRAVVKEDMNNPRKKWRLSHFDHRGISSRRSSCYKTLESAIIYAFGYVAMNTPWEKFRMYVAKKYPNG